LSYEPPDRKLEEKRIKKCVENHSVIEILAMKKKGIYGDPKQKKKRRKK